MSTEVDGGTSGEGFKDFQESREHDELVSMKLITLREMRRDEDISVAGIMHISMNSNMNRSMS